MTGGGPWSATDKYTRLSADGPKSDLLRNVPRQISSLEPRVSFSNSEGHYCTMVWHKIRSVSHFLQPPAIDKAYEVKRKKSMLIKWRVDWREIESTHYITIISARNTGTSTVFRAPFSTTFRWRIFSNQRESISWCPKSPFSVKNSKSTNCPNFSCRTRPSVNRSLIFLDSQVLGRRCKQSTRWRWEEELDGYCRSKLGIIINAPKDTDSSALCSAKARTSRVISTTNFFPTAPSGIEKRFGFQCMTSSYAFFTADKKTSPRTSFPQTNAVDEARWKSGRFAILFWPSWTCWLSFESKPPAADPLSSLSSSSKSCEATPRSLVWCSCVSGGFPISSWWDEVPDSESALRRRRGWDMNFFFFEQKQYWPTTGEKPTTIKRRRSELDLDTK